MSSQKETVLVIGSTGNVGTSACIAALNTGRQVIAVVRNSTSADKLIKNLTGINGIRFAQQDLITVEADIMTEAGVRSVVEKCKSGELPAFQHIYTAAGGLAASTALSQVKKSEIDLCFSQNFTCNLWAYQATIPYLLEQKFKDSTWTICTGAASRFGMKPAYGMSQAALCAMIASAIRETASSNVRVNEVCLCLRVEVDIIDSDGSSKSSNFARVYEQILEKPEISGCRVDVCQGDDIENLRYDKNKGALVTWSTPRSNLREYL